MLHYKPMKYLLVALGLTIASGCMAQNPDIDMLRQINLGRNTSLDPACKFLSNSDAVFCIGIPLILAGNGYFTHDSIAFRKALVVGSTLATASVITNILKYSINRKRPFVSYPDIEKESGGGSPSFPSGHTSSAFSLATSLSLNYPEWYVIIPSYAWAGAVGYSRMHLGVHYPSDVLAGALIGSGSAWLCWKLNKIIFQGNKSGRYH
jgi:membrane-associated phospholipid phosphatase